MSNYIPNPRADCVSPVPCPDPCATEAVRLMRQTQPLPCIVQTGSDPSDPEIINLNVGLAAYWKMEEAGGAGAAVTRYDSASTHHLIPNYLADRTSGKIGFATAQTPGGDPAVYLYNNDPIFISGLAPLSIAGWVRMDSLATDQTIAGSSLPTLPAGWRLWYRTSTNRFNFSISDTVSAEVHAAAGSAVSTGVWYHLAGVLSATSITIYMNNIAASTAISSYPNDTSPGFRVFSDLEDNLMTGAVDELAFWKNRALSAADIGYLYNGGAGRTYPF